MAQNTETNAEILLREQRVAESFAIYQRQQEQLDLKQKNVTVKSANPAVVNWDDMPTLARSASKTNIYWSEAMDFKLAELVRQQKLNFVKIAQLMNADLDNKSKALTSCSPKTATTSPPLRPLSSDDCRIRWSELDECTWAAEIENTSAVSPASVSSPVYKVCIQPNQVGAGQGKQPSFSALMHSSSSSRAFPSYLTVPTSFPSIHDEDSDDDVTTESTNE